MMPMLVLCRFGNHVLMAHSLRLEDCMVRWTAKYAGFNPFGGALVICGEQQGSSILLVMVPGLSLQCLACPMHNRAYENRKR